MLRAILAPIGRRAKLPALLLLCLLPVSCDSGREYTAVPTYPVSGRVMAGEKAAGGAYLKFIPLESTASPDALTPRGKTGSDGRFTLSTYKQGDGAPPGKYAVMLTWPAAPANPRRSRDPAPDRFGGRYADPRNAKWTVEVTEGENVLEPFVIEPAQK